MGTQRRRLAPALRVAQILDAALQEFSASGYAGARMDDIALRAGLSKGGLYAHFSSKEAVFEALIARHLSPAPLDVEAVVDGASSTRDLAERIVDQLYVSLANPAMISAMRLLLAESARVPQLAARWRRETTDAQQACLARLLERARARAVRGRRGAGTSLAAVVAHRAYHGGLHPARAPGAHRHGCPQARPCGADRRTAGSGRRASRRASADWRPVDESALGLTPS